MKKIPDNATRVFEGVIFDVYHWQQEMFDGSFASFEAIHRKESVSIVAVVGDKIIVNHEEQPTKSPFVTIPGGNADGDSTLDAAKRELLEETGYAAEEWQEWFVADPSGMSKVEWENHFYIAKNCKKVKEQELDPGEKIEVTLATFEEFLELRNHKDFRNKDLIPILEKASQSEEEKQTLKALLGITT
jgi:ADP-ribose pyrophosphatase